MDSTNGYKLSSGKMRESNYIHTRRVIYRGGGVTALPLNNRKGAPTVYDDVEHLRDIKCTDEGNRPVQTGIPKPEAGTVN